MSSKTAFWIQPTAEEELLGKFEMGGGEIEPIPAKTQVLAAIDEIKWDSYNGEEYISARWNIFKPDVYKNRKIFQKIKVYDENEKKAEKAKRMLMAIDHNAKGGLAASGKVPDDKMLQKLTNKFMVIMLQVWEMENESGETRRGNWVSAVSPRGDDEPANFIPVAVEKDNDLDFSEDAVPF